MAVFINGIGSISPAPGFAELLAGRAWVPTGNRLLSTEPDYSAYLDPKASRRMSRVVKMGIATAKQALIDAKLSTVDGVIAGTGWGCLEDTSSFLQKMVANGEDMLSPTAFIHSTHNTIAAQIAYHLQCRGYNSTYVHRNISFESTLIDATLLLAEQPAATYLVGGIDELTDTSFHLLSRLGTFKDANEPASTEPYAAGTSGTWAGEGATFFAVSGQSGPNSYAQLREVRTVSFSTPAEAAAKARQMLIAHGIDQADVLLTGNNGDTANDANCQEFTSAFGQYGQAQNFKHWCGEYPTASAFALGWAATLLAQPTATPNVPTRPQTVLIYNRFQQAHQSLMLLTAC